jgi:beta-lactamase regulating signal transducer with metallopeptidase domain
MSPAMYLQVAPFMQSLFDLSLQAVVLIALVLLVQWLFRHQLTAKWRFSFWWLVLICLLVPYRPPSDFSWSNLISMRARIGADSTELMAQTVRETRSIEVVSDSSSSLGQTIAMPAIQTGGIQPLSPSDEVSPVFRATQVRGVLADGRQVTVSGPLPLLLLLWIVGVVILTVSVVRQVSTMRRKIQVSGNHVPAAVLAIFEDCKSNMQVRRTVVLLETEAVQSPALYGLFRLQLLLPKGMSDGFSEAELRHIFLHELAHVKRGDMWLNWLVTVLQILHWFNPVIWFAFARLRADRELACDELALIHSGEADGQNYGQTVLKLLENLSRSKPSPGLVGIVEDRRQMASRLKMIAAFRLPSKWSKLAVVLLLGLGLIGLTGAQTPVREPKDTNTTTPAGSAAASVVKQLQIQNATGTQDLPEPSTVLKGKVLDAATRQPIKSFTISKWEMIRPGPDNPTNLVFRSETGSFQIPLNPASKRVRLNFLVSGYEVTQLDLRTSGFESEHEVLLKAGTDYRGRVLLPEGTPAISAQVAIISAKNYPQIGKRKFEAYYGQIITFTDDAGYFDHPPMDDCRAVVAIHAKGYVNVAWDDFRKNPLLRLQPWGRLDGVLWRGNQPWANQDISLRPLLPIFPSSDLRLSSEVFHVATDVEGRFAFDDVPPGEFTLIRTFRASPSNSWSGFFLDSSHETHLQVAPGKTTTLSLGGKGVRVTGRVSLAGKPWDWNNTRLFASLEMKPMVTPQTVNVSSTGSLETYLKSDAYKEALRVRRADSFHVKEDGAIEAWDLPPGAYTLLLEAKQNPLPPGQPVTPSKLNLVGKLKKEVVIPEPAAGKPAEFDLGDLILTGPDESAQAGTLKTGNAIGRILKGKVLLPDGRPAVGSTVTTRGFGAANLFDFQKVEADNQGSFSMPEEKGVLYLMATHPLGFAQVKVEDFRTLPTIRLEPWGRVEGALEMQKSSIKSGYLRLSPLLLAVANAPVLVRDAKFFSSVSETGVYSFEKIPPGEYRVLWSRSPQGQSSGEPHIDTVFTQGNLMGFVRVEAGKTAAIQRLPKGRTVKATLTLPETAASSDWSKLRIHGQLTSKLIQAIYKVNPMDFDDPYWKSDEFRDSLLNFRDYELESNSDRVIVFEDVSPGEYSLSVSVAPIDKPVRTAPDDLIAVRPLGSIRLKTVVIPQTDDGNPAVFDLGNLELERSGR